MDRCRAAFLPVLMLLLAVAGPFAGGGDGGWTPPPDSRKQVERILEDPVFQLQEPAPGPAEKMMTAVREFLLGLFGRIGDAMAMNAAFLNVVLWTVIAAALFGAGYLIFRLTRRAASTPNSFPSSIGGSERPADRVRSPDELLAAAQAALGAGHGRDVLRLCLQASILVLQSAGYLPADRSMTDLEGARALERTGPAMVQTPFRALVTSHDRLVYAGRQPDSGELDRALDLADRIVRGQSGPLKTS